MENNLKNIRILVVGDIMVDRYIFGAVERISPEAPVPIVNVIDDYETLGGCGNVVRNLRELGCTVDCLASVGLDKEGSMVELELKKIGVRPLLVTNSKITTVKERIMSSERRIQMLRIDRENVNLTNQYKPIDVLKDKTRDIYNIVLVSDYAKGVVSEELMMYLKYNQNADIIVDPKPQNSSFYNGVFMITPNEKEWKEIQTKPHHIRDIKFILETKGNKGMKLFSNNNKLKCEYDIFSINVPVYNVSGAGDTVLAIMGVCLSLGLHPLTSAKIANRCAGYVVTLPETNVVPKETFLKFLKEEYFDNI